ncbi:phage portal protein [Metabacillus litoralis]|uniref:phage portal protein n=1 Tax=Metabacillus litoralis TaxID=152268 RepID=UPI00203E317D|nr:phage portal protein [Metabacillus litoralis]MCM3411883.1 phage portal protein [Metabacillus litoralis]
MGLFDFLKTEKRAVTTQSTDSTGQTVNQPFTLDGLFSTTAITEEKVMKIPTAKACVDLISGTIAQMPVYLYKENADGSIEKVNDRRLKLLNHEANDFLNGYNLKRNMVKDYVLHGVSYVSIIEAGNTVLELHPLPAKSVVVNKKVQNGYRTVGAELVLSNAENSSFNHQTTRNLPTFKPYELMIALQETHDGLTSKGVLIHGAELFKQALAEMEYTQNLYDRGALPLGLLKTEGRMTETQANSLRDAWRNLYGGVKNSAKTVVLQEGMQYQALSMNPNEIQMNDTKALTNSEICKLFGVPEGLVNARAGKQYVSIEQNSLHFLKSLSPIIVSLESAMDRALLLESEKNNGYFFRFDTSEIVRATEKERVDTVVAGLQGGLFTINEARSKFDLPAIDEGDATLITPGAEKSNASGQTKEGEISDGKSTE